MKTIECPSQERLSELFTYKNGNLWWRKSGRGRARWDKQPAGSVCGSGYRYIMIAKVAYRANRLVWIWFNGAVPDGFRVDHINGVYTDNAISNLRLVTAGENAYNMKDTPTRGVSYEPKYSKSKPYVARIGYDGKRQYLGRFSTLEDARAAYIQAKCKYHRIPRRQ